MSHIYLIDSFSSEQKKDPRMTKLSYFTQLQMQNKLRNIEHLEFQVYRHQGNLLRINMWVPLDSCKESQRNQTMVLISYEITQNDLCAKRI